MMMNTKPQQLAPPLPLQQHSRARRIDVLLAGAQGHVGGALLEQLTDRAEFLRAEHNLDFVIHAALSTREIVWNSGSSVNNVSRYVESRQAPSDWTSLKLHLREAPARRWLFIDCTASAAVTALYPWLLEHGVGIVAANKIANAAGLDDYLALRRTARNAGAPFLYETNVGAGLPVLRPLADLRASGDQVQAMEAALSGTMSFLFEALDKGLPFSTAVRRARQLGFTEPHPFSDLSGEDSARKLLIMLREAGLAMELKDIAVEPLLPPSLDASLDADRFLVGLESVDEEWQARIAAAKEAGRYLTQLAYFDGEHARIGIVQVARDDAFAHLQSGENLLRLTTTLYQQAPLRIAGPGAGPGVTAAGLIGDMLHAGKLLCSRE